MSSDTTWHRFLISVTLHWIKLRIKFPCQLYANIKIQDSQTKLTQMKSFSQGNIYTDFQTTHDYQCKLLYGKMTKRYAPKQISIIVYLNSSHGKTPAGIANIQLSQLMRGVKRIPYQIQKCPDKDASLQVTIKMDFMKQQPYQGSKVHFYHQSLLLNNEKNNPRTKRNSNDITVIKGSSSNSQNKNYLNNKSDRGSPIVNSNNFKQISSKSKSKRDQYNNLKTRQDKLHNFQANIKNRINSQSRQNIKHSSVVLEGQIQRTTPRKTLLDGVYDKKVNAFQTQSIQNSQDNYANYPNYDKLPNQQQNESQYNIIGENQDFRELKAQSKVQENSFEVYNDHRVNIYKPSENQRLKNYNNPLHSNINDILQLKKELQKEVNLAKSQIKSHQQQNNNQLLKSRQKVDSLEFQLNNLKLYSHKLQLEMQYKKQKTHQQEKQVIDLSKRLANSQIALSQANKKIFELQKQNRKQGFDLLQMRTKYQESIQKCTSIMKKEGIKQNSYHQQMKSLLEKIQLSQKQKTEILIHNNQFINQLQKRQLKHQEIIRNKQKAYYDQKNILIKKIESLVTSLNKQDRNKIEILDQLQLQKEKKLKLFEQKQTLIKQFAQVKNQLNSTQLKLNSISLQKKLLQQQIQEKNSQNKSNQKKQQRYEILEKQEENNKLMKEIYDLKLEKEKLIIQINQLKIKLQNYPKKIQELDLNLKKIKQDNATLIVKNRTLEKEKNNSTSSPSKSFKSVKSMQDHNKSEKQIEKIQQKNLSSNIFESQKLNQQILQLKQELISTKSYFEKEAIQKDSQLKKCVQYIESLKKRIQQIYAWNQQLEAQKQQTKQLKRSQQIQEKIQSDLKRSLNEKDTMIKQYQECLQKTNEIKDQMIKEYEKLQIVLNNKNNQIQSLILQINTLKDALQEAKNQKQKTSQTIIYPEKLNNKNKNSSQVEQNITIIKNQITQLHGQISHLTNKQIQYINSVAQLQLKIKDLTEQKNFYEQSIIERQHELKQIEIKMSQFKEEAGMEIEQLRQQVFFLQEQVQNLRSLQTVKSMKSLQTSDIKPIKISQQQSKRQNKACFQKNEINHSKNFQDLLQHVNDSQSKIQNNINKNFDPQKIKQLNNSIRLYNENISNLKNNSQILSQMNKSFNQQLRNEKLKLDPSLINTIQKTLNEFKINILKRIQSLKMKDEQKLIMIKEITNMQKNIMRSYMIYC